MATNGQEKLDLTAAPDIIALQPAPFLYLEKVGPFQKFAPLAWKEFWAIAGGKIDHDQIAAMLALSLIDETKTGDAAFVYQAGLLLKAKPTTLPEGLRLRQLAAGKYARFVLTGSYAQLSTAYPKAFSIVAESKYRFRPDFCIEKYLNDPSTTPQDQLQTEILIPVH
ncbi:MAG: GyrI-like domain-containing protein [Proteobacteria bacterium]|nr:GyrI-like domain-containing protein [Pseudomonadota bacterium]